MSIAGSSTEGPLQCRFVSQGDDDHAVPLRPDAQKKSVHWLDDDSSTYDVAEPAHCYFETITAAPSNVFLVGGFQLISTAKTIEVYLIDTKENEAYLTTTRGIPHHQDDTDNNNTDSSNSPKKYYKVVCVIPGGPRPVQQVHLKLLGLQQQPSCSVASLRLTARLPPPPKTTTAKQQAYPLFGASNPQPPTIPSAGGASAGFQGAPGGGAALLSSEDLGAAMAGVSFMVRSAEERIYQRLDRHQQQMQSMLVLQQQQMMLQLQQAQQQQLQVLQGLQQQVQQLLVVQQQQQQQSQQETPPQEALEEGEEEKKVENADSWEEETEDIVNDEKAELVDNAANRAPPISTSRLSESPPTVGVENQPAPDQTHENGTSKMPPDAPIESSDPANTKQLHHLVNGAAEASGITVSFTSDAGANHHNFSQEKITETLQTDTAEPNEELVSKFASNREQLDDRVKKDSDAVNQELQPVDEAVRITNDRSESNEELFDKSARDVPDNVVRVRKDSFDAAKPEWQLLAEARTEIRIADDAPEWSDELLSKSARNKQLDDRVNEDSDAANQERQPVVEAIRITNDSSESNEELLDRSARDVTDNDVRVPKEAFVAANQQLQLVADERTEIRIADDAPEWNDDLLNESARVNRRSKDQVFEASVGTANLEVQLPGHPIADATST